MIKDIQRWIPVCLAAFVLVACGGGGVSESKPISEVTQEAQTMTADALKGMVQKYESAIQAKKADIDKLKDKLKEIPMTEMLGEEAKSLKADVDEVASSVKALTERMKVYAAELDKKVKEAAQQ